MNRLVMAIACSMAVVGAAQADDDTAQLGGFVSPNCFVGGVDTLLAFPEVVPGATVSDNTITILCNDADGANLSLRSSEGGLESDDNEDQEIEYVAVLTSSVIGGGSLTLNTVGVGNNDVEAETILGASPALAGGQPATLQVTLSDGGMYSGGYSDTLSINVEAK